MTPRLLRNALRVTMVGCALGVIVAGAWGSAVDSLVLLGLSGAFAAAGAWCMWAISRSYGDEP